MLTPTWFDCDLTRLLVVLDRAETIEGDWRRLEADCCTRWLNGQERATSKRGQWVSRETVLRRQSQQV